MADFTLEVEPRTVTGKKVRRLRSEGIVPCVVYGPQQEPVQIQAEYRPLEVMLMQVGGTQLLDIAVGGEKYTCLTRDVQRDVLRGTIMHVDFFAIDADATIRADVPVVLIGESLAQQNGVGMMLPGASSLTIETLPRNLIQEIPVGITSLAEIGDSIQVRDLDLGEDIEIINDPDEVLARIEQRRSELALEEADTSEEEPMVATSAEPEVIAKGKEEDEEGEE